MGAVVLPITISWLSESKVLDRPGLHGWGFHRRFHLLPGTVLVCGRRGASDIPTSRKARGLSPRLSCHSSPVTAVDDVEREPHELQGMWCRSGVGFGASFTGCGECRSGVGVMLVSSKSETVLTQ